MREFYECLTRTIKKGKFHTFMGRGLVRRGEGLITLINKLCQYVTTFVYYISFLFFRFSCEKTDIRVSGDEICLMLSVKNKY